MRTAAGGERVRKVGMRVMEADARDALGGRWGLVEAVAQGAEESPAGGGRGTGGGGGGDPAADDHAGGEHEEAVYAGE